jgi:hypothetical protein
MAKKVGLKIGSAILVGGGLYLFFTSDWYKSRYTGFFKKRKKVRDENVLITTQPPANTSTGSNNLGGIYIYGVDGSVISQYNFTGVDMEFPLQKDLSYSQAYDNVAELQAFLVFANADNNLAIDGYFGPATEAAVRTEVENYVGDYGYGVYLDDVTPPANDLDVEATDAQYNTITQEYFNEVVVPELEYFMNADCVQLYDEETCA